MKSIFKRLASQKKLVFLIIVFLFIQAICDLSLPNYTSALIDTGIQNSGIEYAVPTKISSKAYDMISSNMNESELELWEENYILDGDNYILNAKADEKALDEVFAYPIAQTVMNMRGMTTSRESLDTLGYQIVHSTAVSFIKAEYESLGMDLNSMQTNYLVRTGGKMLVMALGMAVAAVLSSLLAAKIGASIGRDLRGKIFEKVVGFSGAEYSKFSTASLITRSTSDVQQIQLTLTMLLRMVAYAPILAIGGIIMVLRTHSGMEWIILLAVIILFILVGTLMAVSMPKFKKMQTLVDNVNRVAREILTGLSVIRAFGREKVEENRFDKANTDLTRNTLFTSRTMSLMMPCMMLLMNGISVLIVWTASHRIDLGVMGVGDMTAFITYTIMIVMSFLMLAMLSVMLPRAAVASERIDEVLAVEPTIHNPKNPVKPENIKGVIKFENVSFRYDNDSDNVLSNIDFTAETGKTTAIIGSTGCGKSTLINLIPRFYDVTEGRITLDGTDIREFDLHDLRKQIGLAPQKGILFSGTIASNIRYGAENAPDEVVHNAAEIAQATEFINSKPTKYESPISQGGTNVSGGQKQRLSIARAVARNPKIYIFDDTFSALDFKTDAALRKALAPYTKDSTVFIVAQRISTIMYADQILVLDEEGRLVGKGTHNELMQSCETYRQIAKSQLSESELNQKEGM